MKTFADHAVLDVTVARLQRLSPDSPPEWGIMSAGQTMAHLDDAFRMAGGELTVAPRLFPLPAIARFVVLRGGVRWPNSFQTVPELDMSHRPEDPKSFLSRREGLAGRMRAFVMLAPEALRPAHPMLGKMSRWEWMRWGYLHTDHHLRQFGC